MAKLVAQADVPSARRLSRSLGVHVKQVRRRISYWILGFLPALGVALSSFSLGLMQFWVGSVVGATTLAWAAVLIFPLSHAKFKQVAFPLVVGVVAVFWFSALAVNEMIKALLQERMDTGIHGMSLLVAALVGLAGPVGCVIHFIRCARSTPNNSFKPTSLRDAA